MAGGVPIVVCAVRGTLYAYCDACAACGASLAGGTLTGEQLTCPGCGAGYDVRLAGRSLDDPGVTWTRCRCSPTARASGSRSRRLRRPPRARRGGGFP